MKLGPPPKMIDRVVPTILSAQQLKQWEFEKMVFGAVAPGFTHLLYTLLTHNNGSYVAVMSRDVPVAATDGSNVIINPEPFFELPPRQGAFVIGHEVVHNVYNHPAMFLRLSKAGELIYPDGVKLPWNFRIANIAADLPINDLLVKSSIGDKPPWVYHMPEFATANDAFYDVYRKIYQHEQQHGQGKFGTDKQWNNQSTVLMPGTSTGTESEVAAKQRSEYQWAQNMAIAQGLEEKLKGRVSADMARMFDTILKPAVPWQEYVRGLFARRLGSGGSTWRRPDRRLIVRDIYAPSRSGHGVNWLAAWGDTSGSILQPELNTYFGGLIELIEELNPRLLTVYWADSQIKFIDEVTDIVDLQRVYKRGVGGGGGTDCRPVFKDINKRSYEMPDAFIGLTDGLATFPKKPPPYPCIWACTTNAPIPFGEVVRIKGANNE